MHKEDLKREISTTIDQIDQKINEMKSKRDDIQSMTKEKYDETLKMLDEKKDDLQSNY